MSQNCGNITVLVGNSNDSLVELICENLGIEEEDCEVRQSSDGETNISIGETVRSKGIFVIQSTSSPTNNNLVELLILMGTPERASVGRVNAVIPCYGCAKRDRKTKAKEPITSKLIADLITVAGADRIACMDLYAGQIQGYLDIPVDHLSAIPYLADYFKDMVKKEDFVVVSPDLGRVTRARNFSNHLNLPIAIIEKRRPRPNASEVMNIIGDIKKKNCILINDIVDTTGTICQAAQALQNWGAKKVYGRVTYGALSGPVLDRLKNSVLEKFIITDTIELLEGKRNHSIDVVSVAKVSADAISRINANTSVSTIFD